MKGNTPTCVGKTKRGRPPLFKLEKHPHVRGEDGRSSCYWTAPIETPPRAWGRPLWNRKGVCNGGNTPTCVGKTVAGGVLWIDAEKHPHVRGEDSKDTLACFM